MAVSRSCRRNAPIVASPGRRKLRWAMRAQASVKALALVTTALALSASVLNRRSIRAWSSVTERSRLAAAGSETGKWERVGVEGLGEKRGACCALQTTRGREGSVLSQTSSTNMGSRRPGEGGTTAAAAAWAAGRSGVVGHAGGARRSTPPPPDGLMGRVGEAAVRRFLLC